MQMSIIEVSICRRLHMDTSMILICIWLICRLCTALHTKCCGAVFVMTAAIETVLHVYLVGQSGFRIQCHDQWTVDSDVKKKAYILVLELEYFFKPTSSNTRSRASLILLQNSLKIKTTLQKQKRDYHSPERVIVALDIALDITSDPHPTLPRVIFTH